MKHLAAKRAAAQTGAAESSSSSAAAPAPAAATSASPINPPAAPTAATTAAAPASPIIAPAPVAPVPAPAPTPASAAPQLLFSMDARMLTRQATPVALTAADLERRARLDQLRAAAAAASGKPKTTYNIRELEQVRRRTCCVKSKRSKVVLPWP
jgi:hypothetical protein